MKYQPNAEKISFSLPFERELFQAIEICVFGENVPKKKYEKLALQMGQTCEGLGFTNPPFMPKEEYWSSDASYDMIKGYYYDFKGSPIEVGPYFICVQPDHISFDVQNADGWAEQNLKGSLGLVYKIREVLEGRIPLNSCLVMFADAESLSVRVPESERYLEAVLKEHGGYVKSFGKNPPWKGVGSYLCSL